MAGPIVEKDAEASEEEKDDNANNNKDKLNNGNKPIKEHKETGLRDMKDEREDELGQNSPDMFLSKRDRGSIASRLDDVLPEYSDMGGSKYREGSINVVRDNDDKKRGKAQDFKNEVNAKVGESEVKLDVSEVIELEDIAFKKDKEKSEKKGKF